MSEKMTIKELAETLGVTKEAIAKHVRELYPDLLEHGKTTLLDVFHVTEIKKRMQQTTLVVSAKTELEIMEGGLNYINWLQSKIQEQKSALEQAQPKIEFFETVASIEGKRKIGEASKELKLLSPNKLFEQLRKDHILMKDNLPYQQFVEHGYFEVNVTEKNGKTYSTTYVTNKGLIWLENKYKKVGTR